MAVAMLGGPCDALALEVGSRLTALLQAEYGDPCKVTVAWDGTPWDLYSYRWVHGQWRGIQYITGHLLAHAIGMPAVTDVLFERVRG
jgi:hypothetical protein